MEANMKSFFDLIRIKQIFFKNSIIVVPLIFSLGKFPLSSLVKNIIFIALGFISLGMVSASSYIINDIVDYEKDKSHPEKKLRPIASGRVSRQNAFVIAILLLICSLVLAGAISAYSSWIFFFLIVGLFLISQFYSFYFRDIVFLDIITISVGFAIRAISGVFIIEGGEVSYWIVLCAFFLSSFMVGGKRIVEKKLEGVKKYRENYEKVNDNSLLIIIFMSISSFFVFFCIYCVFYNKPLLLLSLPVSLYIVFLYFNNIYSDPQKIRNPESFIFTKKILFLLFLWFLIVIFTLILSI